jgi:hypothetical protein
MLGELFIRQRVKACVGTAVAVLLSHVALLAALASIANTIEHGFFSAHIALVDGVQLLLLEDLG